MGRISPSDLRRAVFQLCRSLFDTPASRCAFVRAVVDTVHFAHCAAPAGVDPGDWYADVEAQFAHTLVPMLSLASVDIETAAPSGIQFTLRLFKGHPPVSTSSLYAIDMLHESVAVLASYLAACRASGGDGWTEVQQFVNEEVDMLVDRAELVREALRYIFSSRVVPIVEKTVARLLAVKRSETSQSTCQYIDRVCGLERDVSVRMVDEFFIRLDMLCDPANAVTYGLTTSGINAVRVVHSAMATMQSWRRQMSVVPACAHIVTQIETSFPSADDCRMLLGSLRLGVDRVHTVGFRRIAQIWIAYDKDCMRRVCLMEPESALDDGESLPTVHPSTQRLIAAPPKLHAEDSPDRVTAQPTGESVTSVSEPGKRGKRARTLGGSDMGDADTTDDEDGDEDASHTRKARRERQRRVYTGGRVSHHILICRPGADIKPSDIGTITPTRASRIALYGNEDDDEEEDDGADTSSESSDGSWKSIVDELADDALEESPPDTESSLQMLVDAVAARAGWASVNLWRDLRRLRTRHDHTVMAACILLYMYSDDGHLVESADVPTCVHLARRISARFSTCSRVFASDWRITSSVLDKLLFPYLDMVRVRSCYESANVEDRAISSGGSDPWWAENLNGERWQTICTRALVVCGVFVACRLTQVMMREGDDISMRDCMSVACWIAGAMKRGGEHDIATTTDIPAPVLSVAKKHPRAVAVLVRACRVLDGVFAHIVQYINNGDSRGIGLEAARLARGGDEVGAQVVSSLADMRCVALVSWYLRAKYARKGDTGDILAKVVRTQVSKTEVRVEALDTRLCGADMHETIRRMRLDSCSSLRFLRVDIQGPRPVLYAPTTLLEVHTISAVCRGISTSSPLLNSRAIGHNESSMRMMPPSVVLTPYLFHRDRTIRRSALLGLGRLCCQSRFGNYDWRTCTRGVLRTTDEDFTVYSLLPRLLSIFRIEDLMHLCPDVVTLRRARQEMYVPPFASGSVERAEWVYETARAAESTKKTTTPPALGGKISVYDSEIRVSSLNRTMHVFITSFLQINLVHYAAPDVLAEFVVELKKHLRENRFRQLQEDFRTFAVNCKKHRTTYAPRGKLLLNEGDPRSAPVVFYSHLAALIDHYNMTPVYSYKQHVAFLHATAAPEEAMVRAARRNAARVALSKYVARLLFQTSCAPDLYMRAVSASMYTPVINSMRLSAPRDETCARSVRKALEPLRRSVRITSYDLNESTESANELLKPDYFPDADADRPEDDSDTEIIDEDEIAEDAAADAEIDAMSAAAQAEKRGVPPEDIPKAVEIALRKKADALALVEVTEPVGPAEYALASARRPPGGLRATPYCMDKVTRYQVRCLSVAVETLSRVACAGRGARRGAVDIVRGRKVTVEGVACMKYWDFCRILEKGLILPIGYRIRDKSPVYMDDVQAFSTSPYIHPGRSAYRGMERGTDFGPLNAPSAEFVDLLAARDRFLSGALASRGTGPEEDRFRLKLGAVKHNELVTA